MNKNLVRNIIFISLHNWDPKDIFESPETVAYVEKKIFDKLKVLPSYIRLGIQVCLFIIQIRYFIRARSTPHTLELKEFSTIFNKFRTSRLSLFQSVLKLIESLSVFYAADYKLKKDRQ